MGNAGLVGATSAEERPAVDYEGTAPEGLEVGGTEASGGAAADEYGVVDALPPSTRFTIGWSLERCSSMMGLHSGSEID